MRALEKLGRDVTFAIMGYIPPTYWRNLALVSQDFAILVADYRAAAPPTGTARWSRARIREHKVVPSLDEIVEVLLSLAEPPRLDSPKGGAHPAIREMVHRNDPCRYSREIYRIVVHCMNHNANPELFRIFVDELCCRGAIWKTLIEKEGTYGDILLKPRLHIRETYDPRRKVNLMPLISWAVVFSIWCYVDSMSIRSIKKFLKECPPAIRDVLLVLAAHCRDDEDDGHLGNEILCKLMEQIKYRGMRCSIAMTHKYYPENASCEFTPWKHPHSVYCATEPHWEHAPGAECGPDGA